MRRKRKRLTRRVIAVIVTAALTSVLIAALLITNIFIPVKYLSAYMTSKEQRPQDTMRVTYIDASHGDSTLIELPDGKTMLIDGGDGTYPNMLKLLKTLNSRGIDSIDYLICTSVKREHCGGFAEIVKYKTVKYAYIPYCNNTRVTNEYHSFITALETKKIAYSYAGAGEGAVGSEYFFTFLSPVNHLSPMSEYAALNQHATATTIENASVVTWLEYQGIGFAFTSDVRPDALKRIIEEYRECEEVFQPFCKIGDRAVDFKKCKIVTAPAHAGEDNTYAPWYDLIKPEQTVISVGKNFAGYPSLIALSDICNYCTPLYTSHNGNITVTVNDGVYHMDKQRG
ncbi:MAG: hypothetical protein K2N14_01715 [Clostridia bacterium]|nr:hypothetical protein [Clostridia bacterium]